MPKFIHKRTENERNLLKMRESLRIINWDFVYQQNDVNKAYSDFIDKYSEIYNKCCPIVKVVKTNVPRKQQKPWLTNALKNACRKKKSSLQKFLNNSKC